MHELPLTKDLIKALEGAGVDPTAAEPDVVVVLAAYLDLLAKEYGLSESLALDTDPLERTEQPGPVMDVVRHYLASAVDELDADTVRLRLYSVFTDLAGESSARKSVNRKALTEGGFLHLAQIYWNLEANDARPRLPIKPCDGRDIPVPGFPRDFATMLWTPRGNEKGTYKSSGQGFRTQGARLVVLVAQNLMENSEPMPNTARNSFAVEPTSNPEAPLEIALKDIVKRAQAEGQHDVAVQTASSYLGLVQQRAASNPFESEPDLADAFMLRGLAQMYSNLDRSGRGARTEFEGPDDIEAAISSLSTLVALEPDDVDHRTNLVGALVALSFWHRSADDTAAACAAARRAIATVDGTPVERPDLVAAEFLALLALSSASDGAEAIEAAERAESALGKIEAMDPSERPEGTGPEVIASARAQLAMVRLGPASFDRLSEAVAAAELSVATAESDSTVLVEALVELAMALFMAGRHSEAAETAARAFAQITTEYVRAHPQFQLNWIPLAWGSPPDVDKVTEAHADVLEAASEADPGNMYTHSWFLVACFFLAAKYRDHGSDAEARSWALRGVAAAQRARADVLSEDVRIRLESTLKGFFLNLDVDILESMSIVGSAARTGDSRG